MTDSVWQTPRPEARANSNRRIAESGLRLIATLAAALAGTAGAAAAMAQGNSLGFLARTPAANFDATDWNLLKGAVRDVLNAEDQEAARAWRNDANGHGGHVRVVKSYKDEDGRQCKQVQMDNAAGGYKNSSVVSACHDTDGIWRATDGTPLSFSGARPGSLLWVLR